MSDMLYMEVNTRSGRKFNLSLDGKAYYIKDDAMPDYSGGAECTGATYFISSCSIVRLIHWYEKIDQNETVLVTSNGKIGFITTKNAKDGVNRITKSFVPFYDIPRKGLFMVNVVSNEEEGPVEIYFEEIVYGVLI